MTLTDRVVFLFRAHRGEWIDGRQIAKVGGYAGYRRRLTDCRHLGMVIENQVRKRRGVIVSEYRYISTTRKKAA